ncbi:cytochrome b-c1 complex subunit 7-like isoform X1 [Neodiprion virginianus]|uniref:Cytochrome b-c1 complex subunit 7 n=1 Tax=Neodiprion lecontei TaxID=441921 RepID=A0A6J0B6S0_NEOLC|nr:cytochrome b-c1 complex subunit 7 isoform X1 [Neodiprion lecontei]XP_046429442.1 cytochrome b-c1 complex subunit 7-like isoform X1 [Neodiprion fabricii]XP_046623277.1 cytochrome b-c1 complex subunit 7-like isoform X1 [Neodiprion virginianus]
MSWVPKKTPGFFSEGIKKWAYNLSRFNQYGLHHDDCLHETEVVAKALKRLPQKLVDERNFRILRATQLSITKSILPKEEWTKYEEDVRYLRPYIDEIIKEEEEKKQWNKM